MMVLVGLYTAVGFNGMYPWTLSQRLSISAGDGLRLGCPL